MKKGIKAILAVLLVLIIGAGSFVLYKNTQGISYDLSSVEKMQNSVEIIAEDADSVTIRKNGDGYELSIVVLPKDKNDLFAADLTEVERQTLNDCSSRIEDLISDIREKAEAIIRRDMPPKVLENPRQFADIMGSSVFRRGYVFEQAIADGWLKYDESTPKSVGAYICM